MTTESQPTTAPRRTAAMALTVAVLVGAGCAGEPQSESVPTASGAPAAAGAASAEPSTEDDKTIYAVGLGLARQLAPLHLTEAELTVLAKGISDGALGRAGAFDPEPYRAKIEELANRRSQAASVDERAAGAEYVKKAAAEPGAKTHSSGLVMTTLQPGTGGTPILSQSVQVRYKGSLLDGTVIDSTEGEEEPAIVPMGRVIPCWSQALQLMKEGEKARLVCPPELAYGDRGFAPAIPPGATLVFDVELVKIVR